MSKRNLRPVAVPSALAELGGQLPTQNVTRPPPIQQPAQEDPKVPSPKLATPVELRVQLKLNVRESLHNELQHKALDEKTTVQALILKALKAQGLSIIDEDLVDRRKIKKKG